jgi:hypothetical protein
MLMTVEVRLPSRDDDGGITLRVRVPAGVAEALHDEASHRRTSASRLVERLLREGLPPLAEERVRRHVARALKRSGRP